jgi:multidrug efflux system outer membrane protein
MAMKRIILESIDMKKTSVFLLSIIVILAGSCTMAPKYKKPASPVPGEMPGYEAYKEIPAGSDVTKMPELDWRKFFADTRLQAVMKMALDNNRNLRLAALNVERAMALYGIKRAELLPAVNASGSMSKTHTSADFSGTGKSATSTQYSVNAGIASWEMDFFGRIRSLKNQALEEYLATEQARRSAQISLLSSVANAYLTLATDRGNLKLARSTLESQQASYALIQRRYEVELATKLDLRQAQTQVDAARGDVALYTQLVAQDRNALNLLAGSPVPEDLLPDDLDSVTPPKDILPDLSSEVLLNRPDIMAAEHRLKGAYAYIGAARAACFPSISLTSTVGTASSDLSGLFKSGQGTWTFMPQINIPIFDPRVWAALRVSKVERKIALAQYENVIQEAFREVADTLAVRGMMDQRVSAQQSLVDAVSETYRLSNQRYIKGIDSYLSVLDAQRSLYIAQQQLILLRLTKHSNQVKLYAVLGGGGEPEKGAKDEKKAEKEKK